jgi:hypothetical protein
MPKRDSAPLACVACGHVFGERDGVFYAVIDGKPGVWCLDCRPRSSEATLASGTVADAGRSRAGRRREAAARAATVTRTVEFSHCPRCQGPVPAERPPNRSGTTTDCPHCDALLVWVGYEYSAGWQIVRTSDVESAE